MPIEQKPGQGSPDPEHAAALNWVEEFLAANKKDLPSSRFSLSVPQGQEELFREYLKGFPAARITSDSEKRQSRLDADMLRYRAIVDAMLEPHEVLTEKRIMQNFYSFFEASIGYPIRSVDISNPDDQAKFKGLFHEMAQAEFGTMHEAAVVIRYGLATGEMVKMKDTGPLFGKSSSTVGGLVSKAQQETKYLIRWRKRCPDSPIHALLSMMQI